MWIHQRTGPNSGFSYPGWALLLGLLLIGVAIEKAGPGALVFGAFIGAVWWVMYRNHKDAHQDIPVIGCRWCDRELAALRAQAQADAEREERDRLRARYGHEAPTKPPLETPGPRDDRPRPATKFSRRFHDQF